MHLQFAKKFGFYIWHKNIIALKFNGIGLKTFEIVIAIFKIKDKN